MKRLLVIFCILIFSLVTFSATRHTYVDQSVLSDGKFVKIQVKETGVYAITYEELKDWGLRPEEVRILGYGGNMLSENFTLPKWDDLPSIAFYMHKGTDNVFNRGDYILFYARGSIGWKFVGGRWRHTRNPYSDYGYYFLSDSAGEQRLMTIADELADEGTYDVNWATECLLHEVEKVNLLDKSGAQGGGREFYGESMQLENNTLSFTFDTHNVRTDQNIICFADVAVSASGDTANKSMITLQLGGSRQSVAIPYINVADFYTKAECDSILLNTKAKSTGKQEVKLQFSSPTDAAVGYLNYIEMLVPIDLIMRGNEMAFNSTVYSLKQENVRFTMAGVSSNTQVWRVTNGVDVERMPIKKLSNEKITWVDSNAQAEMYVAVNVDATEWKKPVCLGVVKNQNLHALRNKDYVIICPEEFREQAIRLAKKHEEVDHLTWAVVTDEEVYNEFSSGTPDVSAYRWLMKMLYDRANNNPVEQPKNLLLMGNASYDNRNLLGVKSGVSRLLVYEAKNSIVETKAYGTDDYCGFLTDNAGVDSKGRFNENRAKMNIGVGRLPLRTLEQATQVVDKICTYMDDRVLGKWKTQICFLADDGDKGIHVQTADIGAEKLRKKNLNFVVNKIYLDAYTQEVNASGERYPLAKNQFDNMLNNGVLFWNYSGHGGYNNITNELFMTTQDIKDMSNTNLAFWFLATCSFSHFDGNIPSAGEEAVLNPHGGAIAVLSACRTVYASQNKILNEHLCDTLFGHKDVFSYDMTIGKATYMAKNKTGMDDNKMPYILLGDPALRLNYPTDYQIKTLTQLDTLRALTVHTVRGYVVSSTGDTATWFNGPMDITIWDKQKQVMTNDNDVTDETKKNKILFNDYPNTLFAGQTTIKDGLFEFTFMVPKDIRYSFGKGRMVYYAYDQETREEGVGFYEDFVIGGSNVVEIVDTIGPELSIYLNNPAFQDGDKTYECPHFYANIYDENGINTVGSGIGHDLMMIVDENPKLTFILNDYFVAENNSFQRGKVSFKMPEMEEGAHCMTFRAWDLLNNSNTATLNFQVVKGLDPTIYQVISYPNPVARTGVLHFQIEYDQPNEVIQTEIYMFDLSGRLIKEHRQIGTTGIRWDMTEIAAQPGVYIYQVKIKTTTSDYVSKAGKIIIHN